MPQVNIYIRDEDYSKWASIEKKAEFIHNALNIKEAYTALSLTDKKVVKEHIAKTPDNPQAVTTYASANPPNKPKKMFNDSDDWKPLFKKSGKL